MKNKKSIISIAIVIIVIVAAVFYLTNNSTDSANNAKDSSDVIKVGMSGGYKPYTFVDENGDLTGFDVDVWKEIGKRLDTEVIFVTSDFSGLFGMLDAGQLTTIANQITVTEERQAKYLFTKPYVYYGAYIAFKDDTTDITDLESLKGKKVGVDLGTNYEEILRDFDTDNEIDIITYSGSGSTLQDVSIGRLDAYIQDKLALLTTIQESGFPISLSDEPVEALYNAFPLVDNEANRALLPKIDEAIESMKEDGTLEEISLKYFPIDISKE